VCTIQLLSKAVGTGAVVIFAYLVISKILSLCQTGLFLCPVSLVSLKIRLDN
ncbi:MAG: AraC family transcriptional regulator, partial [Hungatella sp.]